MHLLYGLLAALPALSVAKLPQTRYIVQLDSAGAIGSFQPGQNQARRASQAHTQLYTELDEQSLDYKITHEYVHDAVFVGVAVQIKNPSDVEVLRKASNVVKVIPVRRYELPDYKIISRGSAEVFHQTSRKVKRDGNDTFSTHVQTRVDKVRNELGITGKGIKIAILDTGIDYNNPALGGCYGPNCKVKGGWDLVGDAYDGDSDKAVEDDDPFSDCQNHGTHVAGTIGASDVGQGFSGVAPDADLYMYRIFGCQGGTGDDIIIAGMQRAYEEGAQIISASLGGDSGWSENAASVAASNLVKSGVSVLFANGNSGDAGMWNGESPASGKDVIAVASVDNSVYPAYIAKTSSGDELDYFTAAPFSGENVPVYFTSTKKVSDDGCKPLPQGTDLKDKVVIVRRGICPFTQKIDNIKNAGGTKILMANNVEGSFYVNDGTWAGSPAIATITDADWTKLRNKFNADKSLSISFPAGILANVPNKQTGSRVSDYTTYGPSWELDASLPGVAAIGGNVLSTWSMKEGTYAIISGTSMATPQAAGIVALILEARQNFWSPAEIKDLLQITGMPMKDVKYNSLLDTVNHQGGGIIDAFAAIKNNVLAQPSIVSLNDTANFEPVQRITVTNRGSTFLNFKVSHIPAGTALSYNPAKQNYATYPVPLVDAPASVSFSTESLAVPPGESRVLVATFTPPSSQDIAKIPVYSGYISLDSGSGDHIDTLTVPYYGVAAKMLDMQVLDHSQQSSPGFTLPALIPQNPQNNSLGDKGKGFNKVDNLPSIAFNLVSGCRQINMDIVSADFNISTTYRKRANILGSADLAPARLVKRTRMSQVEILGYVGEEQYTPRAMQQGQEANEGYMVFSFDGTYFDEENNEQEMPVGQEFKLLLRALKLTGNPDILEHYETFLTPVVKFSE